MMAGILLALLLACSTSMLPSTTSTPTQVLLTVTAKPVEVQGVKQIPTTLIVPTTSPIPSTPSPSATRTPYQTTPTPTLIACLRAGGRVEVKEFTTVLLPSPLVYRIYLPPCYDQQTDRFYPVLYLIHGQTYSDTQWDRIGVPETADRLVAAGEVTPFIVVMPRDRVWLEPTEDHFGLAVEQSLIPWIDEHYRTIPDREHRAIGGLSRGGAWAIHLGLSHPELFSKIGLHSGFVFQSDIQQVYLWLHDIQTDQIPRIYMDVANKDAPDITKSASWFEDLLTRYEIPHEWHIFLGEHEEAYWQAHVEDYLRWYSQDW